MLFLNGLPIMLQLISRTGYFLSALRWPISVLRQVNGGKLWFRSQGSGIAVIKRWSRWKNSSMRSSHLLSSNLQSGDDWRSAHPPCFSRQFLHLRRRTYAELPAWWISRKTSCLTPVGVTEWSDLHCRGHCGPEEVESVEKESRRSGSNIARPHGPFERTWQVDGQGLIGQLWTQLPDQPGSNHLDDWLSPNPSWHWAVCRMPTCGVGPDELLQEERSARGSFESSTKSQGQEVGRWKSR